MFLFDAASRHMTWLAGRQAVTAANIANADTPGYQARTTEPFSAFVNGASPSLRVTSPHHLALGTAGLSADNARPAGSWGTAHSGNNVSLESELLAASSATRMMSIDTSLTRSFHRMLLASVKV